MARTTFKEFTTLVQSLRLAAKKANSEISGVDELKNKYKDSNYTGANKPADYDADEEYTVLYKLGPIVDELVDGLEAVEEEIKDIHKYIEGQVGRDADVMLLPPTLRFRASNGTVYDVLTFDEGSGESILTADDVYVGANSLYVNGKKVIHDDAETINITTDLDQNLQIKTTGAGALQLTSQNGGIAFTVINSDNSTGTTTFNSNVTVSSNSTVSGDNATTGLQLGKTRMNGDLLLQANSIIISDQGKIAFGGDATNTYIAANTDTPEDLEIHADQDVILRPDGRVVVGSTAVIDSTGTWVGPGSGLKGEVGAQGDKGNTGAQGPQGAQGSTGPQGDKGNTGAQGPQGAQGAQGPQGDKGNTGAQGPQGAQGAQGPQGDTRYYKELNWCYKVLKETRVIHGSSTGPNRCSRRLKVTIREFKVLKVTSRSYKVLLALKETQGVQGS